MTEIPTHEEKTLREFVRLRNRVHRKMEKRLDRRLDKGNWKPTDLERALDAYKQEIEPQVWPAVKKLTKKGYETFSSGFYGSHCEYQAIDGHFTLDTVTTAKLATRGIVAEPLPDSYLPGCTIIKFYPQQPKLKEMKKTWKQVAKILPNRRSTSLQNSRLGSSSTGTQ